MKKLLMIGLATVLLTGLVACKQNNADQTAPADQTAATQPADQNATQPAQDQDATAGVDQTADNAQANTEKTMDATTQGSSNAQDTANSAKDTANNAQDDATSNQDAAKPDQNADNSDQSSNTDQDNGDKG